MRNVEIEVHHPDNVEHPNGRNRIEFSTPEDTVQTGRNQNGRVRVQAVVEELAERTRQADPTRLFAVDAVQRIGCENKDGSQQPNYIRDRRDVRMVIGAGRKVPVVPREHDKVERREQEADERHHVRRQPSREVVDEVVPKWVHNVQAER